MTKWSEISQRDLEEKLGKKPPGGSGTKGTGDGSKKRRQIKLKRVVIFYGWSNSGSVDYSEELKRTWVFCGRTGETSHYSGRLRDHYNQFAIIELDGNEYMVRWHKQFANTKQEVDNSIEYVANLEDLRSKSEEVKKTDELISESGDFYPLVGKSFWIEDENLINGIKKAKPNVSDTDHEWLLKNVIKISGYTQERQGGYTSITSSTTEYQHRVGEGKRCLLTEFDVGQPQTSDASNKENSKSNETKSSKNEGSSSTSSSSQTSQPKSTFTGGDGKKKKDKNPNENPSKSLLIRYKVVDIYKTPDSIKTGKKIFRTLLKGAEIITNLNPALWLSGNEISLDNNVFKGGIEFGIEDGRGLTDKAYRAEYTTQRGTGLGGAKEVCGNSIVPYIAKGAEAWEDDEKKYGYDGSGDFILNFKGAGANFAKHYLEKHCYFDFQALGDDGFAKYYGITPINYNPNKYGIKWRVWFTNYVGWRMNVEIGEQLEDRLHYESLIKEDYDNSEGLARWIAQGMIMLGTAYIGGMLLSQSAVAAATTTGQAKVDQAVRTGESMASKPYMWNGKPTGRVFGWKDKDTQRIAEAQEVMDTGIAKTSAHYQARTNARMAYAAGRSFAGATRLFSGGKGSYQSGINEFIENKAPFPLLRVEARTSKIYRERWTYEMNKRIANWDFYFGDDPELSEKKDFGKCQGTGRQIFANFHGQYQLSEQTIFPQASPNPLIDYWTKNSIFVYQKCCGKHPHESTCKRPRLTKDDFFGGFEATLTETISREGRKEVIEWTTTEEHTETNTKDVQPTFGFVFAWCGSLNDPTNKIPLGINMGTAGAYTNTVFNGDADSEKGQGKIGEDGCKVDKKHSSSDDISPFRGRQYHQIYWGYTPPSACGELEFGKGDESYNYLVTRFALSDKKAETIQTKKTEESWVLYYNPAFYNAAGGLVFSTRSTFTETKTHKIERSFNPLNISSTISLKGFSGLEGWGDNPPDAFGGGEKIDVSIPLSSSEALKEEVGGIALKLPQNIGLVMPEEIQSMLNAEDIKVDLQMHEMPQKEIISQTQQQQEQIFQHLNIGISEQHLDTERGEDISTDKTTDKEKIKSKKITE